MNEIRVFSKNFLFGTIRYLFTGIGFPPGGSGPYTYTQKVITILYIRRNNTDFRTHKRASETCTTIK